MSYVADRLLPHLTELRAEIAQLREDKSRLVAKVEALEVIAQANENTMNIWEGEAKRLRAENEQLQERLTVTIRNLTGDASWWARRAMAGEATMREVAGLLAELWADESVRAAVGEGDPKGLYARIEAALDPPPVVENSPA